MSTEEKAVRGFKTKLKVPHMEKARIAAR